MWHRLPSQVVCRRIRVRGYERVTGGSPARVRISLPWETAVTIFHSHVPFFGKRNVCRACDGWAMFSNIVTRDGGVHSVAQIGRAPLMSLHRFTGRNIKNSHGFSGRLVRMTVAILWRFRKGSSRRCENDGLLSLVQSTARNTLVSTSFALFARTGARTLVASHVN